MKKLQPILAVLVIFAAGFTSGALISKSRMADDSPSPGRPGPRPGPPGQFREEFVRRMERDLDLSPDQAKQIEVILRESHERMAKLWEPIEPQAREEFRKTREKMNALLTEDQRTKAEEFFRMKRRDHEGKDGGRDRERGMRGGAGEFRDRSGGPGPRSGPAGEASRPAPPPEP